MVKLVVLYGAPEDPAAFDEHYTGTHVPLAEKIPNVRRFEAGKVLGTPDGGPAPFYFQAELCFDSAQELAAAMGTPEGQATATDLGNFATGGVTLMISEV
ncbi:MAG: EthD family reductase [Solirubrobacteraceae bacterium]